MNCLVPTLLVIFAVFASNGCEKKAATDSEPAPVIKTPTERLSEIRLLPVEIAQGGGYLKIEPQDFASGSYPKTIAVGSADYSKASADEASAREFSLFSAAPGFLWVSSTPMQVDVSLAIEGGGRSETRRFASAGANKIAVSLLRFGTVFPPELSERYRISISQADVETSSFMFSYTFTLSRTDVQSLSVRLDKKDPDSRLGVGRATASFLAGSFVPLSSECRGCTIEISELRSVLIKRHFVELPAVVDTTSSLGLSEPARYSGLLVGSSSSELRSSVAANGTANPKIFFEVEKARTQVAGWCHSLGGTFDQSCSLKIAGVDVATYYGFVNLVPIDAAQNLLGGSSGIASAFVRTEFKAQIKRANGDGDSPETMTLINVLSPAASSTELSGFVADILSDAILSGAPQFSLELK